MCIAASFVQHKSIIKAETECNMLQVNANDNFELLTVQFCIFASNKRKRSILIVHSHGFNMSRWRGQILCLIGESVSGLFSPRSQQTKCIQEIWSFVYNLRNFKNRQRIHDRAKMAMFVQRNRDCLLRALFSLIANKPALKSEASHERRVFVLDPTSESERLRPHGCTAAVLLSVDSRQIRQKNGRGPLWQWAPQMVSWMKGGDEVDNWLPTCPEKMGKPADSTTIRAFTNLCARALFETGSQGRLTLGVADPTMWYTFPAPATICFFRRESEFFWVWETLPPLNAPVARLLHQIQNSWLPLVRNNTKRTGLGGHTKFLSFSLGAPTQYFFRQSFLVVPWLVATKLLVSFWGLFDTPMYNSNTESRVELFSEFGCKTGCVHPFRCNDHQILILISSDIKPPFSLKCFSQVDNARFWCLLCTQLDGKMTYEYERISPKRTKQKSFQMVEQTLPSGDSVVNPIPIWVRLMRFPVRLAESCRTFLDVTQASTWRSPVIETHFCSGLLSCSLFSSFIICITQVLCGDSAIHHDLVLRPRESFCMERIRLHCWKFAFVCIGRTAKSEMEVPSPRTAVAICFGSNFVGIFAEQKRVVLA